MKLSELEIRTDACLKDMKLQQAQVKQTIDDLNCDLAKDGLTDKDKLDLKTVRQRYEDRHVVWATAMTTVEKYFT